MAQTSALQFFFVVRLKSGYEALTAAQKESMQSMFASYYGGSAKVDEMSCCRDDAASSMYYWLEEAAGELRRGERGICTSLVKVLGPHERFSGKQSMTSAIWDKEGI